MILYFIFIVFTTGITETDRDTVELKEYRSPGITVTATGYREDISDISSSVSILTESDIRLSNSYTTPDLLSGLPGVLIMNTGNFGRSDIVVRGIGNRGRRIGVLVNGRTEKMPIFGCAVTQTLPLHDIRKIELVRGPLSSIYGSGAMGGVVNIITESNYRRERAEVKVDYGSFNTYSVTASAGGEVSGIGLMGTVQKNSSDGHLENSASSGEDYRLNSEYTLGDNLNLKSSYKYMNTYKETPRAVKDTSPPDGWQEYRRGSLDFSASLENFFCKPEVKIYRTFGHHIFSDGWESRDRTDGFKPEVEFSLLENNRSTLGLEYKKQVGEWVEHGSWMRKIYEGFFHFNQKAQFINLSGGMRYTHDTESENFISWDFGTVIKYKDTGLRLKAGRGFRLPAMNDLFLFPPSNDALDPEILKSYEIGVRQKIIKVARVELSAYLMNTENFIRFSPSSNKFENVDTLNERGAEFSVYIFPLKEIEIRGGYSFIDRGEKTMGIPGQSASGSFTFFGDSWEGRLSGRYVTDYYASDNHREPITSHAVLDIAFNFTPADWITISAGVENILNERYIRYVDLPNTAALYEMPGRTFRMGMELEK